ncbi:MAG: N-acetyltransferase [Oscillospiraceae bacterium]|nr:N-acetyltransferase [Oscillospiraceae bacterium]
MEIYAKTRRTDITIRNERPEDYTAILPLTYEAFLPVDFPGRRRMDEHYLIYLLKGSKSVIPELCFVAELNNKIVGHILYTNSVVLRPDDSKTETLTFGPLSVSPQYQRQGIGAALVRHSLKKAQELGYGAVLITGITDYYPKLGFKRAREFGLTLEDGTAEDYFMAYELIPGYLCGDQSNRFLKADSPRHLPFVHYRRGYTEARRLHQILSCFCSNALFQAPFSAATRAGFAYFPKIPLTRPGDVNSFCTDGRRSNGNPPILRD